MFSVIATQYNQCRYGCYEPFRANVLVAAYIAINLRHHYSLSHDPSGFISTAIKQAPVIFTSFQHSKVMPKLTIWQVN